MNWAWQSRAEVTPLNLVWYHEIEDNFINWSWGKVNKMVCGVTMMLQFCCSCLPLSPGERCHATVKLLTCAHSGCQRPNICLGASASTHAAMPGSLSAPQHAPMSASRRRPVCWAGTSSASSGSRLRNRQRKRKVRPQSVKTVLWDIWGYA